jgi:hypothetical protein
MNAPVQHEAGSLHAQTAPNSSLVLQIDKGVGKQFLFILWASCLISALAVVALLFVMSAFKTNSAKLEILQYDHQALKAQLVAKGLYESTEH